MKKTILKNIRLSQNCTEEIDVFYRKILQIMQENIKAITDSATFDKYFELDKDSKTVELSKKANLSRINHNTAGRNINRIYKKNYQKIACGVFILEENICNLRDSFASLRIDIVGGVKTEKESYQEQEFYSVTEYDPVTRSNKTVQKSRTVTKERTIYHHGIVEAEIVRL